MPVDGRGGRAAATHKALGPAALVGPPDAGVAAGVTRRGRAAGPHRPRASLFGRLGPAPAGRLLLADRRGGSPARRSSWVPSTPRRSSIRVHRRPSRGDVRQGPNQRRAAGRSLVILVDAGHTRAILLSQSATCRRERPTPPSGVERREGPLPEHSTPASTPESTRPRGTPCSDPRDRRTKRKNSESNRRSRHIPAAVRRAVWRRDEGRCAFVGRDGRCGAAGGLEFHHKVPFAEGGEATEANTELRCRTHNQWEASRWFGEEVTHYRGGREANGERIQQANLVRTKLTPAETPTPPSG